MKQLLTSTLAAITFSLSFSVFAETESAASQCEDWAQRAGSFMVVRQMNTPIHEAMKDAVGNVTRGLLLNAYQEPVHEGFEAQQEAIHGFRTKIYDDCMAQFNETN